MNKSKLIEALKEKMNNNNIKEIDDITAFNFSALESDVIEYIKTLSLREILLQILFFNLSIAQLRDMLLPIFFTDNIWLILKLEKIEQSDIAESEMTIFKTNINITGKELNKFKLKVLIDNIENGELKDFSFLIKNK